MFWIVSSAPFVTRYLRSHVTCGSVRHHAGSLRGKVGESILVAKVQRNLASVVGRIYIGTTAKKCLHKLNNELVNEIVSVEFFIAFTLHIFLLPFCAAMIKSVFPAVSRISTGHPASSEEITCKSALK